MSFDNSCSFHVGDLPPDISFGLVDLHQFGELIGDEFVHGETVLCFVAQHYILDLSLAVILLLLVLCGFLITLIVFGMFLGGGLLGLVFG